VKVVKEVFPEDSRLVTKAAIYVCHRYSGAKLKEIGDLFQLTESGITRASQRFAQAIESSETLKSMLTEISKKLKTSIA